MKKIFFGFLFSICIFALITLLRGHGYAVTSAPSDSESEIRDQLIENIASRVAELKLVEKRGIIGIVTEASNTQITITDVQSNTRFIDVDELTKFSSPSAKGTFGISDITKGTTIGALGLYNKESRRLLARFVNVLTLPKFIYTKVDSIDSRNFILNTTTTEQKNLLFDVETSTKISTYSKETGITRSSFSKIKENDDIIVIGFSLIGNENMIAASKIIVLTDFRPKEEAIPATRSGTITPVTR